MNTIVSAELFAIYKTLIWIDDSNTKNDKHVIFTDSLPSVYMIGNGCISDSNIIAKIHKLLHTLTNFE